jgi:hypothetical protein
MSDHGDRFEVTIGNVGENAQVGVGKDIHQTQITAAERAQLDDLFAELAAEVAVKAPADQRAAAVAKVQDLKDSLTAAKPDLDRGEQAKRWLLDHLPGIGEALTGTFVNPILGKLVGLAGEAIAAEFKRRFLQP